MIDFIQQYAVTGLVILLIAAALFAAIRKMMRDRKAGNACGGGCSSCGQSGRCHK